MRLVRLAIAALLGMLGHTAVAQMKIVSEGKATQVRTDEIVVRSERIGRDFLVEVTLLDATQPGKKYAAVYAVDGGLGVAGPASRLIVAGRRATPFFVVAIGYPNVSGRHIGPRNTDLVHRRVKFSGRETGGGGAAFEQFIREDLRPYLEKRYPLDPQRAVLFGHSGGGLFAATVLVTNPDAFSAYVIGGLPLRMPGLEEASPLPQLAKAIAPRGKGQRVFLGYAPSDALNNDSDKFAAVLSGPDSKFQVRQEFFADETHNSEYLQLLARGLPFVLPTDTALMKAKPVNPTVLARHIGKYRLDAERVLEISRDGNELFGRINASGGLFALTPASDTQFFSQAADAIVTFDPPISGKSPRLVVRTPEQESAADRID